jgi:hypothetical protein
MNRHKTVAVLLVLAAAATASDAAAQRRPEYQPMPHVCTFDECAMRIRAPTLQTPSMLVRGLENIPVVQLGLLEPAVAPFLQLSDSAVAQAEIYDLLSDRGSIITIGGTAIAIVAPLVFRGAMQKIGFTAAGIGLTIYGGTLSNRANDNLSRALWWYNRELALRAPPTGPPPDLLPDRQ